MERGPATRDYLLSSLLLMIIGWGGLGLLIFVLSIPPLVWARWGFFALWFTALSGTALPVAYFLNVRFPSDAPAEPHTIVRQACWVGVYGSILAWLQLGNVMAFWMWTGLAGGLVGIEYLFRLRERSRWRPPDETVESVPGPNMIGADEGWLEEPDEPTE
jgi:hypothetical protein